MPPASPPSRWVQATYRDAWGRQQRVPRDVRERLEELIGPKPTEGGRLPAVIVAGPGQALTHRAELVLEDGTELGRLDRLPRDVPFGYHQLRTGRSEALLVCGPGRCPPPRGHSWGWAVQLYAARSRASWGIGDLADLRDLARWSAGLGAGFLVVNPLNAETPAHRIQPSPYFPSSRRFHSPLYLRMEDVPGAGALGDRLERLAAAGRALNGGSRIDRDAVFRLKMDALEAIWETSPPTPGLAAFRAAHGSVLREWATFAAIAERHGAGWSRWPGELRRPAGAAVARFAAAHADRIAFHEWVQWLIDDQLRRAAEPLPPFADLPVGVDPDGADAWSWQDLLALDASVGAPPDRFNAAGQDWGLPPFVPDRLRAAGFEPFIQTLRAALRHAGGLRIDHVIGLFRLWLMPRGGDPAAGAYVRYPSHEMLAILVLEAHRAGVVVVGEDLGTVQPGDRRELRRRGILSYRLAYFERRPPARYPRTSLAAVTTHDLPTVAGTWLGTDLDVQRRAGLAPDASGLARLRRRLVRVAGVGADAPLKELVLKLHHALAASPAALVAATLEDAARAEERPNLPGTVDQHPNWSVPLPTPLEELTGDQLVKRLAAALRR